jgi:UTP--glucose-1-phosphate uridylyltransferase
MIRPIRKAVFPVAGLGTRFLPATKAIPKEMIPVVDRPVIEITVEEAREAGIEHFVFVTGRNKGAIEDHFDKQFELEATLEARGKTRELEALQGRPAASRPGQLHPPAGAAGPRPRGVVRPRHRRRRALSPSSCPTW